MRLLGLDFETTGFNTATDRVIEIGVCLWDTQRRAPIDMQATYVTDDEIMEKMAEPEIEAMCERVSGITRADLAEFGRAPHEAFQTLLEYAYSHDARYIVAHNGENYDRPLLLAELARHGLTDALELSGAARHKALSIPWLDTRCDIPFLCEPDSRKLKHLALDCGFINPFPHRAVTDVLTMMRVLDHYDINKVIEYSQVPFITVRAVVSFDDREKAKAQRYSWEKLGDKVYPKRWVKRIKADRLEEERKACNFEVMEIKEG